MTVLTLYHNDVSTCAQKVRIVLAEKGLGWESRELDLREGDQHTPEYRALNPKGVVPTLVHDDVIVTESTVICEYLDDAFPEPGLRPEAPAGRARMRLWAKRINDRIHGAIGVLSYAIAFRHDHLKRPDGGQAMLDATRDPMERTVRAALLSQGLDFSGVGVALGSVTDALEDAEAALVGQDWLAGDHSLADACWLPYLHRLDQLRLGWLWTDRPGVAGWYARARARPSYAAAITAVERTEKVEAMNRAGEAARERVAALRDAA